LQALPPWAQVIFLTPNFYGRGEVILTATPGDLLANMSLLASFIDKVSRPAPA
jgi:hypothetical protein